jgi:hypothetical protein
VGNADLYGLGIRIGMYLQTLSTILAEAFVHKMALDFRDVNAIFLLALLIAMLKATIQDSLTAADGIVMLRILWCFVICAMSKGIYPMAKGIYLVGQKVTYLVVKEGIYLVVKGNVFLIEDMSSVVRTILELQDRLFEEIVVSRAYLFETDSISEALSLYFRVWISGVVAMASVYFWYDGFDRFYRSSSCPLFLFYFAKLDAIGGARTFYKVASVPLIMYYGYLSLFPWCAILVVAMLLATTGITLGILTIVGVSLNVARAVIWIFKALVTCLRLVQTRDTSLIKKEPLTKGKERNRVDLRQKDKGETVRDLPSNQVTTEFINKTATDDTVFEVEKRGPPRTDTLESTRTDLDLAETGVLTWMLKKIYRAQTLARQEWGSPPTTRHQSDESIHKGDLCVFAVCLVYWIWSIIGIEMTLKWNSATDVYGLGLTAQLIPFVIGVASFVQVAWRTVVVS